MSETLICVVEDVGVRVWLERVLEDEWSLEFVSASDLSRVSRLASASGAKLALVAISEDDPEKAVKLFSALHQSNPGVTLVGVARHISQDALLQVMRAGARDCLITAVDSDRARERVQSLVNEAAAERQQNGEQKRRSITLVVGASSVVDTRFFAQNLASELNDLYPEQRVLAVDTMATENHAFYFDSLSRLSLNDLVNRTDSIDESFVNTALEECRPGLRLLSGQIMADQLSGDTAADLFIAISRLAELFDHLIIRVVEHQSADWLKILGADLSRLMIVANPMVEHVQYVETMLAGTTQLLGSNCQTNVVIDGFDKKATLALADMEKRMGTQASLKLPLDWLNRLDSINAGVPLSALLRRSSYQKGLAEFAKRQYSEQSSGVGALGFFKKRAAGKE